MISIRAGAFNLTDEAYWWYADVRGLPAQTTITTPPPARIIANPVLPAYTQPGRNYSVSLTFRY